MSDTTPPPGPPLDPDKKPPPPPPPHENRNAQDIQEDRSTDESEEPATGSDEASEANE